jgi:hypothetical protein
MAVATEHAGLPDAQQIHPVALGGVQTEGAEPDILGLGNPYTLIFGDGVGDDDIAQCFLRIGIAIWGGGGGHGFSFR